MFIVTVLAVPSCWKGMHGVKPGQTCFLQHSFCRLFDFHALCWAAPHTHFPHVGLAGSRQVGPSTDCFREDHPPVLLVLGEVQHPLRQLWSLPTFLSELLEHLVLACLLRAFFHCRGSLVTHSLLLSNPSIKFQFYFLYNPEKSFCVPLK